MRLLILSASLLFAACAAKPVALPAEGKVLQGYLDGTAALANDDYTTAHKAFSVYEADTKAVAELSPTAAALAKAADLKEARRALNAATLAVAKYSTAKGLDKAAVKFYFCPMSKQGGNWASLNDKVENPYFGNGMRDCGQSVTPPTR